MRFMPNSILRKIAQPIFARLDARDTLMTKALDDRARVLDEEIAGQAHALHNEMTCYVADLREEIKRLNDRMHAIESDLALALITSNMQTRLLLSKKAFPDQDPVGLPLKATAARTQSFESYLEMFKKLHPHLYDTWAAVNFGVNVDEFAQRPEFSCGVSKRPEAQLFAGFAAPYLRGRVLDVGCGPYPVPNYLEGYPTQLISGIDPLEPFDPHPFEFVRGFAEFLPWEDATFDVVVAATSLDHTLDLELALAEIRRVSKPDAPFLVWEWFAEEAPPYDPATLSPKLIDRYHLFNFDQKWFERITAKDYAIVEHVRLCGDDYSQYHYYSLKPHGA
jgi:SAM-dependent methyltransferase